MNTISWGQRSEYLTKLHVLQTIFSEYLQAKKISLRDQAHLVDGLSFIDSLKKIKTSPEPWYVLIENYATNNPAITARSTLHQRILDPVSVDQLNQVVDAIQNLISGRSDKGSLLASLTSLQIISYDLAHEIDDGW